ncbi:MAG: diaminopimelate decarboxylase [Clostridiales bacterium]|jgi:diaminopimelate decarboxylase|nr:diaminopimelate decarboxylase [Clostridiales bacterium]
MVNNFLDDEKIFELIEKYGSPLYVYSEDILRGACRGLKNIIKGFNFEISYSIKANSNIEIIKIIKSEGLFADAFSIGEMFLLKESGFKGNEIFYVSNNASADEFKYAMENNILISLDSVSQIEKLGRLYPGSEISIRLNPGRGFGHSEVVVTAGENTKFGISQEFIPEVLEAVDKYNLKLVGINQHLGSLFLDYKEYVEGARSILNIARQFKSLKFVDLGGGFGVPYKHTEARLDLEALANGLNTVISEFVSGYDNKGIIFKAEPGRYLVAESGILLGTVNSVKKNYKTKYVGTDLGLNVLIRPAMYGSYHELHIARRDKSNNNQEIVTVTGNICETDTIAEGRLLPSAQEGDIIAVLTAGAYGYSMSSNYNSRLRPAEVLIKTDGSDVLIRGRDSLESLLSNY